MVPQLQTRPNSAVGGGPKTESWSGWALNRRRQRGLEKVQGLRKDAGLGVLHRECLKAASHQSPPVGGRQGSTVTVRIIARPCRRQPQPLLPASPQTEMDGS